MRARQFHACGGFAIGTILLAVVLIAAIVSAIAIASRGSQSQSDNERMRIDATALVNAAIQYQQAFSRAASTGFNMQQITFGTPVTLNENFDPDTTPCWINQTSYIQCTASNPNCFFGADRFMNAPPTIPPSAFCNIPPESPGLIPQFQLRTNASIAGIGNNLTLVFITGIQERLCRHINSLVMNRPVNFPPPESASTWFVSFLANSPENQAVEIGTGSASAIEPGVMDGVEEGCFSMTSLGWNIYYRVMR